MKKIDVSATQVTVGSGYPAPYDEPCRQRKRARLGDVAGLTQFGVNLLRLPPGVWSSQRHWHSAEDEFVYVLEGEVVLVTDAGEEVLRPGDCAGFKAGDSDGHHLQNRTTVEAVLLEVGGRAIPSAMPSTTPASISPSRRERAPSFTRTALPIPHERGELAAIASR